MAVKIAVVGLGYVGLPLAVSFAKKYEVLGYDVNSGRVSELSNGFDQTNEVSIEELTDNKNLALTNDDNLLAACNVYIVTVPTPVDEKNEPDLRNLKEASKTIARHLKLNDTVIYESTVYPGLTEEICIPLLESGSNLKCNEHFSVGYSPERINPGDKAHTFEKITKVVSASNLTSLEFIAELYGSVVSAGIFKASSIKVAEAAKVIENTQRDLNIALMNELYLLFNALEININEVLEAAETKWNFLKFRPGLVGGHCIGVDPYYLTAKAKTIGFNPNIILSGRELNDSMWKYFLDVALKKAQFNKNTDRLLLLGLTFKEDVPDFRNSQALNLVQYLSKEKYSFEYCDPYLDKPLKNVAEKAYLNFETLSETFKLEYFEKKYKLIFISVTHKQFLNLKILNHFLNREGIIFEIQNKLITKNFRLSI